MTDQPRPLAEIAREAMQRTFFDLLAVELPPHIAEALVESAFDAIGDAAIRHLSVIEVTEADANL
ncbi:hypothetical protein [Methylorubrum suomiense]|uniref:Uncharacterized protein n=1 Tax=Methylorubrum suomiense TaxID=144191 RepID=A0ABQ4UYZ8_9HYPH|nr:hypothetical protein [Methylorubrum suomiense]GJE77240.1 hypothetical protein BGCPKDLD_3843 [Methylorubrum suomiense]